MPTRLDFHVAPGTPGAPLPRGRRLIRNNPVGLLSTDLDRRQVQALVCDDFRRLPEAAYLLLRVNDKKAAAAWLKWIVGETRFAAADDATTEAVNVAFTHAGLRQLGIDDGALGEFPEPFEQPDPERP